MYEKKRLAVFVTFDADGIVDDYIPYLLKNLLRSVERLIVIVNGKINVEGRKILEGLTKDLVARDNIGFDFGAWKYALEEYVGWPEIEKYDELVLLNDSCFGPLYPFEHFFDQMEEREADFWGLIAHGEVRNDNPFGKNSPYGYLPKHLQSSFLVIRRHLLHSNEFQTFWKELPTAKNYLEAVSLNECVFTKYFADRGFSWCTLIDTRDMDGNTPIGHAFFSPGQLLLRGMPMLKTKAFAQNMDDLLNVHMADDLAQGLNFIREQTDYDERLIFQHILRKYNIADIHDTLHLDYVLSRTVKEDPAPIKGKVLVLLHLYYMDLLESERPYIEAIPEYADVLITTVSEEKKQEIERVYGGYLGERLRVIVMKNRGRETGALLVAARPYILEYDYICFCQDKKSAQVMYGTGASFSRLGWENMLSSREYVENVLSTFEKEPCLGLLVPPRFFGGAFLYNLPANLWTICYDRTVEVARMLGLKVDISHDKGIICTNTMFWARTKALLPLLQHGWKYEDFEAEPVPIDGALRNIIERILQFVAQDAGFYTGIMMTPEYASIQTNAFFYLVCREMKRNMSHA